MSQPIDPLALLGARSRVFQTTQWSVVLAAGDSDPAARQEALATLCERYWPPAYAFIRKRGHDPEAAEDLTQEFFSEFLRKQGFSHADPARGRFRSFLMTSVENFLISEHVRQSSQKRGGGVKVISLTRAEAEEGYAARLADLQTPAAAFEREWACTLLTRVLAEVGAECSAAGRWEFFEQVQHRLWDAPESLPFAEIAGRFAMTETAAKVAAHRIRRRYRELLEQEIADTLESPDEFHDELAYLRAVLTR